MLPTNNHSFTTNPWLDRTPSPTPSVGDGDETKRDGDWKDDRKDIVAGDDWSPSDRDRLWNDGEVLGLGLRRDLDGLRTPDPLLDDVRAVSRCLRCEMGRDAAEAVAAAGDEEGLCRAADSDADGSDLDLLRSLGLAPPQQYGAHAAAWYHSAAAGRGENVRRGDNWRAAGPDSDEESNVNSMSAAAGSGAGAAASGNYGRFSAARAANPQGWDWDLAEDAGAAGGSAGGAARARDRVWVGAADAEADVGAARPRFSRDWDRDVMDLVVARAAELGRRQNERVQIYDGLTGQLLKASGTPMSAAGAGALEVNPRTLLVMAPAKQVPSYEQWIKNNGEKTTELFTAIRSSTHEALSTFLRLNPTFNVHTLSENSDLYQPVANSARKPLFEVCLNTKQIAIEIIEEMAKLLILHTKSQPRGDTSEMINHVDSETSLTPLMLAAKSTSALFSLFLLNGGDPFVVTQTRSQISPELSVQSPIHFIAKYGKLDNLRSLVSYFNITTRNLPLWKAEVSTRLEGTQLALGTPQAQSSPLIKLIFDYAGWGGTIKELVNLQPAPRAKTPLFYAVLLSMDRKERELRVELVRSLLQHDADPRTLVSYKSKTLSVLGHSEEGFGTGPVQFTRRSLRPGIVVHRDGRVGLAVRGRTQRGTATVVAPEAILQLLRAKVIELDNQDRLARSTATATAAASAASATAAAVPAGAAVPTMNSAGGAAAHHR